MRIVLLCSVNDNQPRPYVVMLVNSGRPWLKWGFCPHLLFQQTQLFQCGYGYREFSCHASLPPIVWLIASQPDQLFGS
jgi:hypothetical protein